MLRNNRGAVLLEVVLAFALLLIGMLPLVNALTSGAGQLEAAARQLAALELTQAILEDYSGRSFTDIAPVEKASWPPDNSYQFAVVVEEPDYAEGCLKIICVTVFYYDYAAGRERNITLTGAKANG